jgi:hypothetical protein
MDLIHYAKQPHMWLAHLHGGPILQTDDTPGAALAEWCEIYRRLYIPYYEEARKYFDRAEEAGELSGMNETTLNNPKNLKHIVEEYGD